MPERVRDLAAGVHRPDVDAAADVLALAAEVMVANESGQDMRGPLENRLAVDRLLPGHQLHGALDEFLTFVRPFQGLMGGGTGDGPTPEQVAAMEALAVTGEPERRAESAVHQAAAGVLALDLGEETDPGRIDEGIAKLRLAVEHAGPDNPQRVMALYPLAVGLLQRFEQTNAVAEMEEAAALLQEAVELAGGPHHPMWTQMQDLLSRVLARLGRPGPAQRRLDGLRGHTYNVLFGQLGLRRRQQSGAGRGRRRGGNRGPLHQRRRRGRRGSGPRRGSRPGALRRDGDP